MIFLPPILLFSRISFATGCSQLCVRTVMLLCSSCCDSVYLFLLLMLFFPIPVVLIWDVHFSPHQVGVQQFLQRSWSSMRPSTRSCTWIEAIPGTNIFGSENGLWLGLGRKTLGHLWTKSWIQTSTVCLQLRNPTTWAAPEEVWPAGQGRGSCVVWDPTCNNTSRSRAPQHKEDMDLLELVQRRPLITVAVITGRQHLSCEEETGISAWRRFQEDFIVAL